MLNPMTSEQIYDTALHLSGGCSREYLRMLRALTMLNMKIKDGSYLEDLVSELKESEGNHE